MVALHRYVTPDEAAWVYRAVRFGDAVHTGDWQAIPNTGHPGAVTMWLGALGILIQRLIDPASSAAHLDWIRRLAWLSPQNDAAFNHLAYFLSWGRIAIAATTTLGAATLHGLLKRAYGQRVALVGLALVALNPFLIGHSGLLHTDALLATFTLLAMSASLNGAREPDRPRWWALAGVFTALALATKTPALLLLPACWLILAVGPHVGSEEVGGRWWRLALNTGAYLLSVAVGYGLLYPALWSDPVAILETLFGFAGRHVAIVQRPVFFLGQVRYDPGPLYYPVVWLCRSSPVVLVGLGLGGARLRALAPDRRFAFVGLSLFAVAFGALMSLATKKHDRYLLPALVTLAIPAALALSQTRRSIALPIALQLALALAFCAYPLTYANPLAGGPWGVSRAVTLDWGEGTGAAARWLNRRPRADRLTVATDSIPTVAPLFAGRVVPLDQAAAADYSIGAPPATEAEPPVAHTVRIGVTGRTTVFTNSAPLAQGDYLHAHAAERDLILFDAETALARGYDGPGETVNGAELPTEAALIQRLAKLAPGRGSLWYVANPTAAPITAAHVEAALHPLGSPVTTETVGGARIAQYELENEIATSSAPPAGRGRATFGQQLDLLDARVAEATDHQLPVHLRWRAPAPTRTDLLATLSLRDGAGDQWTSANHLVINEVTFPTSAWDPEAWGDQTVALKLPARIPPDRYTVTLTLSDGAGAQLGVWEEAGQFKGVSLPLDAAQLKPPAEPVGAPACQGSPLEAGALQGCLLDPNPRSLPSGDALSPVIIWTAHVAPEGNQAVRWHLVDLEGTVVWEAETALSPYPTSRWRADDSFRSRYRLCIPPTLPAGAYTLTLNILDGSGAALWSDDRMVCPVEVVARDRSFTIPADIDHPLAIELGDLAVLHGVDIPTQAHSPGDALELTLYWEAHRSAEIDYTLFVHLIGPDGQIHGQVDRQPAAGEAPTTSWVAGEIVTDAIDLPIDDDAPLGRYHVAVGLYDGASGGRLPVITADGARAPDDRLILPIEIRIAEDADVD